MKMRQHRKRQAAMSHAAHMRSRPAWVYAASMYRAAADKLRAAFERLGCELPAIGQGYIDILREASAALDPGEGGH